MANEKLIYAHEVKAKLRSVRDWFGGPPQTDQDKLAQAVVKVCIEEIDKLKPVDAAPVVRCGDCAYATPDGYVCFGNGEMMPPHPTYPDRHCSCGERRTDNA